MLISIALSKLLNLTTFQLNLNRNDIRDEGLSLISSSLGLISNLRSLKLNLLDNMIGEDGVS